MEFNKLHRRITPPKKSGSDSSEESPFKEGTNKSLKRTGLSKFKDVVEKNLKLPKIKSNDKNQRAIRNFTLAIRDIKHAYEFGNAFDFKTRLDMLTRAAEDIVGRGKSPHLAFDVLNSVNLEETFSPDEISKLDYLLPAVSKLIEETSGAADAKADPTRLLNRLRELAYREASGCKIEKKLEAFFDLISGNAENLDLRDEMPVMLMQMEHSLQTTADSAKHRPTPPYDAQRRIESFKERAGYLIIMHGSNAGTDELVKKFGDLTKLYKKYSAIIGIYQAVSKYRNLDYDPIEDKVNAFLDLVDVARNGDDPYKEMAANEGIVRSNKATTLRHEMDNMSWLLQASLRVKLLDATCFDNFKNSVELFVTRHNEAETHEAIQKFEDLIKRYKEYSAMSK